MKLFLKIIIGSIVLYLLGLIAFVYEEHYRKLIRWFYELLSLNRLSFQNHGKYLHFANGAFIFAFCAAFTILFFLLKNQNKRLKFLSLIFSFIIFWLITIIYCFLDSFSKLAECTACQDGTRILAYNEIQYDLIFVLSLSIAIIPVILLKIKKQAVSNYVDCPNS